MGCGHHNYSSSLLKFVLPIFVDFQSLNTWIKKASNLIKKEGIPGPYVSMLIQLEDFVKETQADKEVTSLATFLR